MPILDASLRLANAYAPTTAATTLGDHYVDNLAVSDIAAGASLLFYVEVAATVTSGGSATVQFKLIGNATDNTFGSGNVVLADTGAIAKASLTKGTEFKLSVSRNATQCQFFALQVIIGTADLTAGTFNSWIQINDGLQDATTYASGYTVK